MRARAPASSANLGPGYDVLAIALGLYCEVTVEPADRLEVTSEGEGAELPTDGSHLAASVVRAVLGHDDVAIHVRSEIFVSRGLGSSAALALAAAAAAGSSDPLAVASAVDGHAENAAASMLGGLVAAAMLAGEPGSGIPVPIARQLRLDPGLAYVLVVPERTLQTNKARAVLSSEVPLADAVHNLGRMGLLVAGLADRSLLVPEAGDDHLHQGPRSILFPEAPELLARLEEAGAIVAAWSGAGPSMIGICDGEHAAERVRSAGEQALVDLRLAGRAMVLRADVHGLVVER
ncbi:MAG: homoserine kinase [Acidimicrobiales bacterium]